VSLEDNPSGAMKPDRESQGTELIAALEGKGFVEWDPDGRD